jgi:tRNA-dihydrouridine synthase
VSHSVQILHAEKVSACGAVYVSALLKEQSVGLATSFLSGSKEEWSLVRRHPSETMFGVQVAGSKPVTLVPTAEVIAKECNGGIDFVDLNCGCPIDLVFRTGSGSARTCSQHPRLNEI